MDDPPIPPNKLHPAFMKYRPYRFVIMLSHVCCAMGSVSHGAMLFPRRLCNSRDVAVQAWSVAAGYRGGRHPTERNADPVPGPRQWCEPVANGICLGDQTIATISPQFTNTSGSNIICCCYYRFLVQCQPKSILHCAYHRFKCKKYIACTSL